MAGQCLRGPPEAAWGRLHLGAPASSHLVQAPEPAHQAPDRWETAAEVLGGDRSWGEGPIRSPQVESGRRNYLVELVEEAAASVSPMVATAEAIRIARESSGGREGRRLGLGWVGGSTQTRAGWLSHAGWAGRTSRPVGPAGLVGRIGLCQLNLIQISSFKFKC
jgi:hypothetical protein